ncbi:MAG TPA: flavodoxin family protein [Dehalococcoidia bacterium]|nr:flavodoxin family protein [Dehalococcoidia bacterium]
MKVLGIVASHRRLGNTEILVKEALMATERDGAEVEIVRWQNYRILPCEGLATCLFGGVGCKLKDVDDHNNLLEMIYQSDGVVFGAPCYIKEATAVVKQFIDRLFILGSQPSRVRGKPAVIIMPYATRGYTQYAFLQPNILLRQLGMKVIDRALVHTQGMNEAVAHPELLERVCGMGKALVNSIRTGDTTYLGEPGICPICHDRIIRIRKDGETVECGTCGITGKVNIEGGKIKVHFSEEQLDWIHSGRSGHAAYEILPSKDYFRKLRPILREGREKYREYLQIDPEPAESTS